MGDKKSDLDEYSYLFRRVATTREGRQLIGHIQNMYETLWVKALDKVGDVKVKAPAELKLAQRAMQESCMWFCRAIAESHKDEEIKPKKLPAFNDENKAKFQRPKKPYKPDTRGMKAKGGTTIKVKRSKLLEAPKG